MNTTKPNPPEAPVPLTPELKAEAAAWVALLHSSGRSASMDESLRKWLASNPSRARAFEVATEAWNLAGSLQSGSLPRLTPRVTRNRRLRILRPAFAVAAVAAAAVLLVLQIRGQSFSTATGEQRLLTLDDGTRVALNTNSRMLVRYSAKERHVWLEAGEAYFEVAKNPLRPFIVTAGGESVTAVGTTFEVRRDSTDVEVTLVEGRVSVQPANSANNSPMSAPGAQMLSPGERLRIQGSTPTLDKPSVDAITAWRRGEIVLDHTRLGEAVTEMNRYSNTELVLSRPQLADLEVSGVFRTGDSARFANAVSGTYELQVAREGNRLVLSGEPRNP